MKKLDFYIVDVFAEKKFAGNQLAVFTRGRGVSTNEMQKIAREMNFSETTFIMGSNPRRGGFDVRIFTPEEEMPFAGHPTLGTAYVIREKIIRKPVKKVTLNLKAGPIPVDFDPGRGSSGIVWMTQLAPKFGRTFDRKKTAQALGLMISDFDPRFPVQEVSTGVPFAIAPLRTLKAIRKIQVDRAKFIEVLRNAGSRCILVFCPQTYSLKNDLNVRMFAPLYGIPEDPATGSANGCLAGYLVKHRYFNYNAIEIRVEQGYEINRPSLLYLNAHETAGRIHIRVGGKVFTVGQGFIFR
jgi:trans-2,3-dihydro-3-hydroxyanthranilate isomerase